MGVGSQHHVPADLLREERTSTHCRRWVGLRVDLDECRKEEISHSPTGVWIPIRPAITYYYFVSIRGL